ncbi:MAG: glutathione S-transferase family protein [Gammaproteobacteria bacterium]|nr:glutathione S-transferase family protein [Gammaproteobacteria bacterium]
MYKLYWHRDTSSTAAMAILEEIGQPYDMQELIWERGDTKTPEYLKVSPFGLFPALELGDGTSMFESAAMVQILCDRHPEINLAPLTDEPDRSRYLQWLFYLSNTIYPSTTRIWHPERYTTNPEYIPTVKGQAQITMMDQWQELDTYLNKDGPYLLGDKLSACDIYLQMITTWMESPADLLNTYSNLRNLVKEVVSMKSCQIANDRHNPKTGLEED